MSAAETGEMRLDGVMMVEREIHRMNTRVERPLIRRAKLPLCVRLKQYRPEVTIVCCRDRAGKFSVLGFHLNTVPRECERAS